VDVKVHYYMVTASGTVLKIRYGYRVVLPPNTNIWVISKEKHLPPNYKCCVRKMASEVHARQEMVGSNSNRHTHAYFA
jgi:hypothetical protein